MADKKKLIKTILRSVALGLVGLILGLNLYMWNARSLMGNALPMPFGLGSAVVLTGSMEPEISANDLIFVKAQEQYQVNDVVVYQSGSILVVHRIIEMDGTTVTTKGDANNAADDPVDLSVIKGRVVGHIPNAGALVRIMKSPLVSIALLAGAIFLLERSYRRERKKGDDELDKIKEEIRRLKDQQA